MRLKKIKILGFKSFADSTQLEFHPGITAIVGPNGCGKSNVSDSFRWVLGEQSAKSMRGSKMHDVIFAGTAKRKPLNMSEVTITLESEGDLPTEYEEVSVTRRLHRSGESEYLLNRRPVRLKDIYDLFLDSGIGKNAFSIFEQGKIDQVINLNPLERRHIFEEAAGILRFLQRKREALKRFEQTEQNISRVRDIHREVERQIIILEEQAAKAKVYKENKSELEQLELGLFVAKWDNLNNRTKSVNEREQSKKDEIAQRTRDLHAADVDRQNGNIRLNQAHKALDRQKEKVFETRSEREVKTNEWKAKEEHLQDMIAKEQQWTKELKQMIEKRELRQIEIEKAKVEHEEILGQLSGLEGVRSEQKEKLRDLELEVNKVRDSQHEMQRDLMVLLQTESQVESEFKQTTIRYDHINERKGKIAENHKELENTLHQISEQLQQKSGEIGLLSNAIEQKKGQLNNIKQAIEEETKKIEETQAQLDTIYQERAEVKARQSVLLRLRDEMEGFSSGTKKLLHEATKQDSSLFQKVKGLYESLTAKKGAEMALSVVMRPYTQTLVVDTEEDFNCVVAYAKEKKLRDFSILCSAHLKENVEVELEPESLLARVTKNLISSHFLKNVLMKSDTKDWTPFTKGQEVWTDDGVFIDRNGVVFYTSEGENNVFLREAELKALEQKLLELETARSQLEAQLKGGITKRSELQEEVRAIDQSIRENEMTLVGEKGTQNRLEADREKITKEIERENDEVASLEKTTEDLKIKIDELHKKHAEAVKEAEERQLQVNALNDEIAKRVEVLKEEQQTLQDKESSFQKVAEEKRRLDHQINVFEVKDLESLQQEKRLEDEIQRLHEQHSQFQLNRAEYEAQVAIIEKNLLEVQEKSQEFEQAVQRLREEVTQIEEQLGQKREGLKKLESEQYELGIQKAQIQSSREALEIELHERFHITIAEAREKEIVLEETLDKTEKKIRSIRRKIEDAGDINMTSIEEFDKYKERYEFLNQQIDDLIKSKDELLEIITQLDTESRKIFKETFEVIRDNFKKNYQILFNGGEADLIFTESGDILEAGVEISAKPPGKQMRSINLLSGGEKCLTAVALLFAIFEVKPAPFCILDEIDAPLDDTNVERFLNVVKKFTDKCQFIIITHNKRTMAIADRLYGVSMQERGVSKLLSLEFSREASPEPALVEG